MKTLSKAWAITRKDIIAEMRTRDTVLSVLVFALLVIVIFNFAFGGDQSAMLTVAPGILWATFAFAGVLGLNRAFVPEKEQGCLEGLMACPVSREVIYIGKGLGSLIFMLVVEAIALPIFGVFVSLPVLTPQIIAVTLLTTVGFVSVGTLFSALAVHTRAKELVLPILFFPIVAPIVLAAVESTELALAGESWGEMASWLQIVIAFDVVFAAVSYLVFSFVIEE